MTHSVTKADPYSQPVSKKLPNKMKIAIGILCIAVSTAMFLESDTTCEILQHKIHHIWVSLSPFYIL